MQKNSLSAESPRPPFEETTNGIFVGNLSFFCEENHLFDLFNEYGTVKNVRIVRNDNNTRSLMFGFVTMLSAHEAVEMARLLNNHLFMGRAIRYVLYFSFIWNKNLSQRFFNVS